jgi:excisionase family DNA binding protein
MPTSKKIAAASISQPDQREILETYTKIRAAEAKLVGPDGKTRTLPTNLSSFLVHLLGDLKAGKAVTISQATLELTTVEAARLLSVSRQFFIGLLDKREIPFHKVGTHRRIYASDVLAYKARRDSARRKTLDALARAEMTDGIYGRSPSNDTRP